MQLETHKSFCFSQRDRAKYTAAARQTQNKQPQTLHFPDKLDLLGFCCYQPLTSSQKG